MFDVQVCESGEIAGEVLGRVDSSMGMLRLVSAAPVASPARWAQYCDGLRGVYEAMGVGHLAADAESGDAVSFVIVVETDDGVVVGGTRFEPHVDLGRFDGFPVLRDALAARAAEINGESCGSWVMPELRSRGLGFELMSAQMMVSGRGGRRYSIGLCNNDRSLRAAEQCGAVRDEWAVDLPFPNDRFRSSLVWFDHSTTHGEAE